MAIQFRRGVESNIVPGNVLEGEPVFADDTKTLFIGHPDGLVRIADVNYVDTKVSSIASGSPKGSYPTLAALEAAYPIGASGIYVVQADNKWYFWDGSAWQPGGTYVTNLNDYNVIAPYCTAAWDSSSERFVITLPAEISPPADVSVNMLLRVNFTSDITWDANGLQTMCIAGMYGKALTANVGDALCGKTLKAGTYLVIYDGKFTIIDAAQQLGCHFANPVKVDGSFSAGNTTVSNLTAGDTTVNSLSSDGAVDAKYLKKAGVDVTTGVDIAANNNILYKQMQSRLAGYASGDPVASIADAAISTEFNSIIAKGRTTETGSGTKSPSNPYIISGESPTNVKICRRNLINKTAPFDTLAPGVSSTRPVSYDATNDLIVTQGQSGVINSMCQVIVVKPNTMLYFSAEVVGRRHRIVFIREDGSVIELGTISAGSSYNKVSFNTQSSKKIYLDIMFEDTATAIYGLRNVMLSYDQLDYESYSGQTIPVSLSAPLYEGDYYNIVSDLEMHNKRVFVVDGINVKATLVEGKNQSNLRVFDIDAPWIAGSGAVSDINCTHFNSATYSTYTNNECVYSQIPYFKDISINMAISRLSGVTASSSDTDLLTAVNNWFAAQKAAGTPVTLICPSASPITYQHTANNIEQPGLNCNISADGAPVDVSYTVDISSALASKVDKARESLTVPGLLNGWAVFTAISSTFGYYRTGSNITLVGALSGGSNTDIMFQLATGDRPLHRIDRPVVVGGAFGAITIDTNGNVYKSAGANSTWVSVDGISFRTDI